MFLYYLSNCFNIINSGINERPYTNISNNFFINHCFFERINKFNGFGGVFNIIDQICNLELDSIVFYRCTSSEGSGVIFFLSKFQDSSCLFKKNCILKCHTNNLKENQIGDIQITKNLHLIYCSMYKNCIDPFELYQFSVLNLISNNFLMNNLNSTNNKVDYYSCFSCLNTNFLELNFCSFSNHSTDSDCFYLYNISNSIKIENCNIFHQYSKFNGVFHFSLINLNFLNCYFINNHYLLFYNQESFINVYNSYFDNNPKQYGNIIFLNTFLNNYQVLELTFYSTFLCEAKNIYLEECFIPEKTTKNQLIYFPIFLSLNFLYC